ncbi:hypothetical protein [Desulforegula conservatrix]|uniref:hypothetical protein n=1 Tax=Desulforegula conservatrix TaxID=153026 RepID=UPI0018DEA689|nr:hypothetical protein [Desulforegula conservatrix]
MKSSSSANTISKKIIEIKEPQNKIVDRLKAQMISASAQHPGEAYSRMHSRHNRS